MSVPRRCNNTQMGVSANIRDYAVLTIRCSAEGEVLFMDAYA